MECDAPFTQQFGAWWDGLDEGEQESVDAAVRLLEARGIALRFPHSSGVATSKHPHMRELRVQRFTMST